MRTGQGFLAIWSDVRPAQETDYLHWLTREHTEERVSILGFLGVRVFRSRSGGDPRYFILYKLESAAALASPDYLERLNAPSAWSARIMPILGNFRRGGGTVIARRGQGAGAVVAPLLLDREQAIGVRLGEITAHDRIAAASLLKVDGAGTAIQTSEKTLRSGDQSFEALLLVEALDQESLAAALGRESHEVFDQVFALDKAALAS
jgi:hypothetical protein